MNCRIGDRFLRREETGSRTYRVEAVNRIGRPTAVRTDDGVQPSRMVGFGTAGAWRDWSRGTYVLPRSRRAS